MANPAPSYGDGFRDCGKNSEHETMDPSITISPGARFRRNLTAVAALTVFFVCSAYVLLAIGLHAIQSETLKMGAGTPLIVFGICQQIWLILVSWIVFCDLCSRPLARLSLRAILLLTAGVGLTTRYVWWGRTTNNLSLVWLVGLALIAIWCGIRAATMLRVGPRRSA